MILRKKNEERWVLGPTLYRQGFFLIAGIMGVWGLFLFERSIPAIVIVSLVLIAAGYQSRWTFDKKEEKIIDEVLLWGISWRREIPFKEIERLKAEKAGRFTVLAAERKNGSSTVLIQEIGKAQRESLSHYAEELSRFCESSS